MCLLLTVPCPGLAQTTALRAYDEPRPLPVQIARGWRVGSALLSPMLRQAVRFDDNIFASEERKASSFLLETVPGLQVRYAHPRYELLAHGSASLGRNLEFSSENYLDREGGLDAIWRVGPGASVSVSGSHAFEHLPRDIPDGNGGLEPITYRDSRLELDYGHLGRRFGARIEGALRRLDFNDQTGIRNGALVEINEDDRDRLHANVLVSAHLTRDHLFQPTLEIGADSRSYAEREELNNADRTSWGLELKAGFELALTELLSVEVLGGFRRQAHRRPFPDISAPTFRVGFNWQPSGLWNLRGFTERSFQETPDDLFSGIVRTQSELVLEYEPRRSWLVTVELLHRLEDYKGLGAARRSDVTVQAAAGARYVMRRNASVALEYRAISRDSDSNVTSSELNNGVEKNLIIIELQVQI